MAKYIPFTKMHGAGNDYIYVNTFTHPIDDPAQAAIAWSAPHTGIGSDGLVLIGPSVQADFSMRIFNADGSEAMMCGNASRCIGKYVYERGLTEKTEVSLETLSGIKILKLKVEDDAVKEVTVDMLEPVLANRQQLATPDGSMQKGAIEVDGEQFTGTYVCMGNPHVVIFVDDVEHIDLTTIGPKIEHHPLFPERVNVEFAQLKADGKIRMRVWERGSGITMACGTGACATAVAATLCGLVPHEADIIMDGGTLHIQWSKADNHVYMTGPATHVFDGVIALPESSK
jgi:diaminopimelate epimerase